MGVEGRLVVVVGGTDCRFLARLIDRHRSTGAKREDSQRDCESHSVQVFHVTPRVGWVIYPTRRVRRLVRCELAEQASLRFGHYKVKTIR